MELSGNTRPKEAIPLASRAALVREGGISSATPIAIVSDLALVRDCLKASLSRETDVEIVGVASGISACADVSFLCAKVVLLDGAIADGPALWQNLRQRLAGTSLVVFDMASADAGFLAWAEAGATGYVGADCSVPELVHAIRSAQRGEIAIPTRLAGMLLKHVAGLSGKKTATSRISALTGREHEILEMIAEGMSNKLIALKLKLMESTIKNHVHNILEKTGTRSRGEAAARLRRGRLHEDELRHR